MKKSILFVDDERQILRALYRLFFGSAYTIYLAESGEQALAILEKEEIGIIITDMRMPHMDGYQLLKTVKEKHPTVLRLILSGYADEDIVFKALSKNLAKLYLFKPWDNNELRSVIDKLFETGKTLKDKRILDIINNIEHVPMKMNTYNRLSNLISQDSDMKDIAAVIEEDPGIAAKVLHIANSAYYGAKTGSISQATIYLGLINIRNIVLTASVFEKLVTKKEISKHVRLLYDHACLCNRYFIILYEKLLRKNLPDIYSSSGLLHDLGKVILMSNFTKEYIDILETMVNHDDRNLIDIEMQMFSATHQDIGGYLLDWWELPYPIVETVLFHHTPLNDNVIDKELVSVVHIADYISWEMLGRKRYNTLDSKVFDFLKVTLEECREIIQKYVHMDK